MVSRKTYNPAQTKENILMQARNLFSQKGYTATSIRDICDATGVSKGSIYHHFKNKEDLFIQLAEHSFGDSWKEWDTLSAKYSSVIDKLYAYSEFFVETVDKPLNKAGEDFMATVGLESEEGQKFLGIVTGYAQRFENLVAEGIASGEFKPEDPKQLSFIILSYYSGLSDSHQFLDKEAMKGLFRNATDLLLDGIRNKK